MARQIVKKENGLYAVWSTIVEDFIVDDVTKEQVIGDAINMAKVEALSNINAILNKLDKGEKPYYQFTMTYEEMLEQRNWNK